MAKCVGYIIKENGEPKMVARVGRVPVCAQAPELEQRWILLTHGTQILRKTDSVGIDMNVWLAAVELGVEYFVFHVPSRARIYYGTTGTVRQFGLRTDESEGLQLHVPLRVLHEAASFSDKVALHLFPWPTVPNRIVVRNITTIKKSVQEQRQSGYIRRLSELTPEERIHLHEKEKANPPKQLALFDDGKESDYGRD